jgi:hypothetical protein
MDRSSDGKRLLRRQNILAAGVLLVALLCVAVLAGFILVETQFRPAGSAFGLPTRIPLCGRTFSRSADDGRVFTRAEIDAGMSPGYSPVILEPSIGEVPLLALFEPHPNPSGMATCDVLIFLHAGPDAYIGYALEGGP